MSKRSSAPYSRPRAAGVRSSQAEYGQQQGGVSSSLSNYFMNSLWVKKRKDNQIADSSMINFPTKQQSGMPPLTKKNSRNIMVGGRTDNIINPESNIVREVPRTKSKNSTVVPSSGYYLTSPMGKTQNDPRSVVPAYSVLPSTSPPVSEPLPVVSEAAPTNQYNSPANTAKSSSSGTKALCCDKCDGKHLTDDCPYYKKKRDDHPDARKNKQIGGASTLPGSVLTNAKVIRQPGDGSCLFHSMSYGLRNGLSASRLRSEICSFISSNPNFKISETPLKDWIKWDSGSSCESYARNMSRGAWGGGIEMACFSTLKDCNVHVYERNGYSGGFKRISAFDQPVNPQSKPIVRVLYCGGVHYDALVV